MIAFISSFLGSFFSYVLIYKYVAIFLISFSSALILPLPASSVLAAAGAFASQGYLDIYLVLLSGVLGNVGGDISGYYLSRKFGIPILNKIGFKKMLASKWYASFKEYLLDFPQSIIYVTRFLSQGGPIVNILAGLVDIPFRIFIIFDILGETSYVLLYSLLGYFLGAEWENNTSFFVMGVLLIVSIGIAFNLLQVLLYKKRKKKKLASHT